MTSPGAKKPFKIKGLGKVGGEEEDRTPDLCIANAALSQLSYPPNKNHFSEAVAHLLAGFRPLPA